MYSLSIFPMLMVSLMFMVDDVETYNGSDTLKVVEIVIELLNVTVVMECDVGLHKTASKVKHLGCFCSRILQRLILGCFVDGFGKDFVGLDGLVQVAAGFVVRVAGCLEGMQVLDSNLPWNTKHEDGSNFEECTCEN
ncbi:unnamed protein product [Vicia faba]|uniref:Uncharacterized protein n=1 Tax=Vicia faba TaxID=3906 RepID=A0AAV1AN31_VICFA|nr:unnamed protein product [Vicia faba]